MQLQQPQNYTINSGGTQDAFMGGMKQTASLIDMQQAYQANQQKMAQAQYQMEQDRQKQEAFRLTAENPTSENVMKMMLTYPEITDQYKESFSALSAKEKESSVATAFSVVSALDANKPEVAIAEIDRQIEAANNSNDPVTAERLLMKRNLIEASPDGAKMGLKGFLFAAVGPEKYAKAMGDLNEDSRKQELQPSVLKKSEADANTAVSTADKAAVVAKFAESQAAMDLQKAGWDIKKIQNDISVSRQNVAIAAMNAKTSAANASQSNSLKAQENQIKLAELVQKRDETVRAKTAELESARSSIDNMLNTTDKILKTPMGVVGSAAGPISSRIMTISQSTADFEAMIENLDAQSFMAQIPMMKGAGALSDAEGKKLGAALQNFSLKQSPEQLMQNVREAQRIMLKARTALASKYGMPDTVPDTPNAAPSGGSIEDLLKKYGQ